MRASRPREGARYVATPSMAVALTCAVEMMGLEPTTPGDPVGGWLVGRQHSRLHAAGGRGRCRPTDQGPRGRPGRPRKRPAKLHGDKGVRHEALCDWVG